MKLVGIVLLVGAAFLALPRVASAWNDTGHMTVALVAWRQLDDAQRQQVGRILRAHPHYERFLLLYKPQDVAADEWAFLKAATWPDFVRPTRPGSAGEVFKGPEITRFHRAPWHYVVVPWVHPLDRKTIDPTTMPSRIAATLPSTHPDEPRDVLEALEFNAMRLSTAATSDADRAVALAWMEHLVGDLHQPLHACTVYSRDFPGGDQGGNEEAVRFNDIVQRLHAFWDGALGTSEAYVMIDLLASDLLATPQLEPAKLPELRQPTTYADWATESHRYAIGVVHLNGYLRSARYAAYDAKELAADAVPPLPASYYANARELSKRRVVTAGYRLAERVKALRSKPRRIADLPRAGRWPYIPHMSLGWSLFAVPVLIGLNAFFVMSEYAVVAMRPAQVAALAARGRRRAAAAMAALQSSPAASMGGIQVCITMTNLMLGWIGEPAMSEVLRRAFGPVIALAPGLLTPVSVLISFIVVTLLTVVFSELLPKALTLRYVVRAAAVTAAPVLAIRRLVHPLVWVMTKMANAVTTPLGLGSVEDLEQQRVTADELRLMAIQAAADGVVTPRERSLVLNSLSIGRRTASQIMVPRTRVAYVDLRWTMEQNLAAAEKHLFSRMPLCNGGMDKVVGVMLTRELITAYHAGGDTTVLELLARPPQFLPETLPLDRLIETFHDNATQMAFLVDEYGGVEGIVTLREVVDELFRTNQLPNAESPSQ